MSRRDVLILAPPDTGTHRVSAILNLSQETDSPWPLHIMDFEERRHRVELRPGDMLWYEGARSGPVPVPVQWTQPMSLVRALSDGPANVGIVRGTVSVATMVVVCAGGRRLSCDKVSTSPMQR